jgi:hypothetical protein
MDQHFPESERRGSIKSLTLQDLVNMRPPFFGRLREIAKTGLMIWGAVSLSAAAGYAALHLQGGPETSVLRSDRPAAERSEPAIVSVAAPAKSETLVSAEPTETELARLPRPRPDEPIVTGSIASHVGDPDARRYAQNRYADPCDAWNSLGLPFRLHCIREGRAAYQPDYRYRW